MTADELPSSADSSASPSGDLLSKTCVPCRKGAVPLTPEQIAVFLRNADGWEVLDGGRRIEREYRFGDFKDALAFVTQLGAAAEQQDHHPDISFGWGWATVSWQTMVVKGLHENDFIMAAKTDQLAGV